MIFYVPGPALRLRAAEAGDEAVYGPAAVEDEHGPKTCKVSSINDIYVRLFGYITQIQKVPEALSEPSTDGAKVKPTATSPSDPLTERDDSAKKFDPLKAGRKFNSFPPNLNRLTIVISHFGYKLNQTCEEINYPQLKALQLNQ